MKTFVPTLPGYALLACVVAVALVSALFAPSLMLADESSSGGCGTAQDNDCDGALNTVPGGCNVCSNFDVDLDDNNANVGNAVDESRK